MISQNPAIWNEARSTITVLRSTRSFPSSDATHTSKFMQVRIATLVAESTSSSSTTVTRFGGPRLFITGCTTPGDRQARPARVRHVDKGRRIMQFLFPARRRQDRTGATLHAWRVFQRRTWTKSAFLFHSVENMERQHRISVCVVLALCHGDRCYRVCVYKLVCPDVDLERFPLRSIFDLASNSSYPCSVVYENSQCV